ncbi:Essential protein Yae1 [Cordyceps fumosorosea ARSEF 2679]|uniref:Essential protein Yae1 n=1 Tax=Cordyceps fumosorosea (strain ARSEF 2679) TaxID=1081104 RepID=A0A167LHB0_CORFA|nr:Essential protein Yae1 [Cordyceps fumosorosea ARSEF 2679]OAA53092.1 Essential protein Yae1 [Cordyceps fumosorosea ARSEF 2679]
MASDPFDDVFTLEDRFYRQGYQQGLDDGAAAGRVEGRQFGMSTGFDKFLASGRLASRALVWANRLPSNDFKVASSSSLESRQPAAACTLPPLPDHPRLGRNVRMVYALVEPETLSTTNADEAVQDFDDRFKRAQGKAKVVEKMIG